MISSIKIAKRLPLAIILAWALGLCLPGDPAAAIPDKQPSIRVLIAENQTFGRLTVKGRYLLKLLPGGKIVKKGEGMSGVPVVYTPKGIRLGSEEFVGSGIRIEPAEDRSLYFNQTRFRGVLNIVRASSTPTFYGVNTLDLEGYLYGVLHHEVAHWWPLEALKAQAVASRTYALYQIQVSKSQPYDVKSGTSSQVYGGSTVERYRVKRAVDATQGQVLVYQGKIFPAYFHATCAGVTAASNELWKIDLVPLRGGARCGYCRFSPHYFWEAAISLAELEEKMNKFGNPVGQILKVEVISQTPSGRAGSLRITGTEKEMVIAAKDFRVWVGGDKIRSTRFTVGLDEDSAVFHGKGWGHGVGLCQWGTLGQALLGHTYQEILKFYYPGSEVTPYASG
ncbi:MAG: SpoIID/LytB domain-containing protein [Candidatus Omnitrophica bacterium]|nr:SpoIID/LytB domain-containing protein [Candidatus Omnitrophota bacterium]